MVAFILPANSASSGDFITNSLRFNAGDSPFLNRQFSGANTSRKKFTISFWVKRSPLGSMKAIISAETNNNDYDQILFTSGDQFEINNVASGADVIQYKTSAVFRDTSAYYNVVAAIDTTQASASNGIKIYINGVLQTSLASTTYAQNATFEIGRDGSTTSIGRRERDGDGHGVGYLSDFYYIDGQQLTASEFGETNDNGVWIPKAYSGSYGNNGFFLNFSEPNIGNAGETAVGNIGSDYSGNANHFASSGITTLDQTTDTPTNNFATLNSLSEISTSVTFSEGNTKASIGSGSTNRAVGSMGFTSGKWYYEVKYISTSASASYLEVGFVNTNISMRYHIRGSDGERWDNTGSSSGTSYRHDPGDIIGVYIDADNQKWYLQVNGSNEDGGNGTADVSEGTGFIHQSFAVTDFILPYFANASGSGGHIFEVNFGNPPFSISSANADANGFGSFEYNPTNDGVNFYSLCTKNLAEFG